MTYESSPAAKLVATHCAVCNRALVDAISVEVGMGPDCRENSGFVFDPIKQVDAATRANAIVHDVATGQLTGTAFVEAMRELEDIGFGKLSKTIWFRRRREFAPAFTSPKFASGVPRMHVVEDSGEVTVVEERTLVHATSPAPLPVAEDQAPIALPFKLTEGQDQALAMVHRLKQQQQAAVGFIKGYAGTGKTTMLRVVASQIGGAVVITPTGKAALRVKEATGLPASTIHRWLYKPVENPYTGAVSFKKRGPGEIQIPSSRYVLLDEASMVGPDVWKDIWDMCQLLNLKLVCVGDGFQLPPVQPPNAPEFSLLKPEFAAGLGSETVELTEVLRQAQDSPVVRASMKLRAGDGVRALKELVHVQLSNFGQVATSVYQQGGVVICHRNVTRFKINDGIRMMLGIKDEYPQKGEPMLVLKNTYEVGLLNGECAPFTGWHAPPKQWDTVRDKYMDKEEQTRFGATLIDGKIPVIVSVEELQGKLTVGQRAIRIESNRWARVENIALEDTIAPHLHANFGYAYTAHKSQGSSWPWVFMVVESSIRLNQEEGRRWTYTALTRAEKMAAIYLGNI